MPERIPANVEAFRLAERGQSIEGTLPLAQLRRLVEAVGKNEGEAMVQLHFSVRSPSVYTVSGSVKARLNLTCQRCLGVFEHAIDSKFEVALARSETEASRLQADFEPIVAPKNWLSIEDLIEDELLLSLPIVAAHEAIEDCGPAVRRWLGSASLHSEARLAANPFSVLRKLKKQ